MIAEESLQLELGWKCHFFTFTHTAVAIPYTYLLKLAVFEEQTVKRTIKLRKLIQLLMIFIKAGFKLCKTSL